MALNRDKINEIAQPRSQEEVEAAEQRKEERSQFKEAREALSDAYTKEQMENCLVFSAEDIRGAYKEGFRAGHNYARMTYHIT